MEPNGRKVRRPPRVLTCTDAQDGPSMWTVVSHPKPRPCWRRCFAKRSEGDVMTTEAVTRECAYAAQCLSLSKKKSEQTEECTRQRQISYKLLRKALTIVTTGTVEQTGGIPRSASKDWPRKTANRGNTPRRLARFSTEEISASKSPSENDPG